MNTFSVIHVIDGVFVDTMKKYVEAVVLWIGCEQCFLMSEYYVFIECCL